MEVLESAIAGEETMNCATRRTRILRNAKKQSPGCTG